MEDMHLLFMYLLLMCILILNDLMNNIKNVKSDAWKRRFSVVHVIWMGCTITSDNADLNNNATV